MVYYVPKLDKQWKRDMAIIETCAENDTCLLFFLCNPPHSKSMKLIHWKLDYMRFQNPPKKKKTIH